MKMINLLAIQDAIYVFVQPVQSFTLDMVELISKPYK